MASRTRSAALALYKRLLREGQKFTGYNYRMYALRRIKDGFRESAHETDASKIQNLVAKAEESIVIMRRQAAISQLYKDPVLVIEATNKSPTV